MKRFITILSFTRIHTASLTMPVLMIAALLSDQSLLHVFIFAVYALFFHMFGFSLNNIMDYRYDMTDPYKKHFPQVAGEINMRHALYADIAGIILTFLLGAWIVSFSELPVIFLLIAFTAGVLYNAVNKISIAGPPLISLSFSMLIPYVMLEGSASIWVCVFYTLFAFITMMYQIGVSGYVKDAEVQQYNLMAKLGMHLIAKQIIFTTANRIYAWILRMGVYISGLLLLIAVHFSIPDLLLYTLFQAMVMYSSRDMLKNNAWQRPWFLKAMSGIEILNYISLVFLLTTAYGIYWAAFLIAFPMVWFIAMNHAFYGTTMAPNV